MEKHTADYTLDDYACFFERCLEIHNTLVTGHKECKLRHGVENTLLLLAERDPDLYRQVLMHCLGLEDPLWLDGRALVQKLLQQLGYDATLHFLNEADFPAKQYWLFHLHEALPPDAIDEERLGHLYDIYQAAEPRNLPLNWDYLLKYLALDPRVVAKALSAVLGKTSEHPNITYVLGTLFNPHTEVAKRLPDLFAEDLDLLKRAYLLVEGTEQYSDYEGKVFDWLLDLDPAFIEEYIACEYSRAKHGSLSRRRDHRDFTFIWTRPDYEQIMDKVIDCILRHKHVFMPIGPYLGTFFYPWANSKQASTEVLKKQDGYLLRLIDERSDDSVFMEYLFGVISRIAPERRYQFVARFVQRNGSFEAFKRLPLEPIGGWVWGSQVSMLQECVNYWESLLPIFNTVELLPHRQYVERRIRGLRAQIEREKKNDFIED